jgi:hypothetical protein
MSRDAEVTVCFANPNIHPAEEYDRRRDTLRAYADDAGIEVIELPYEPEMWAEAVAGSPGRPARCEACYRLRIDLVADEAARRGYDAVATTLTVSPYQDPEAICKAGREACDRAGVAFIANDFRDRYPEATRRSRELGMYRQNYCGCLLSMTEAQNSRALRREVRRRQAP